MEFRFSNKNFWQAFSAWGELRTSENIQIKVKLIAGDSSGIAVTLRDHSEILGQIGREENPAFTALAPYSASSLGTYWGLL